MTKIGTAIYENGVFKPEQAVTLESGARVEIVVAAEDEVERGIADFKKRFPGVVGGITHEEATELMAVIDDQFGRVYPRD